MCLSILICLLKITTSLHTELTVCTPNRSSVFVWHTSTEQSSQYYGTELCHQHKQRKWFWFHKTMVIKMFSAFWTLCPLLCMYVCAVSHILVSSSELFPEIPDVYVCCIQICPYVNVVLVDSNMEYAFNLSCIYFVAELAS